MPDKKEITIYDIAEHLKISAATVSRGLQNNPSINKNTRKKITDAAIEMGYRTNTFASSLRTKENTYPWCNCSQAQQLFCSQCIIWYGRCCQ
jgi:hypothetical protein